MTEKKIPDIQTAGEIRQVSKGNYAVFEQIFPDIDGAPEFVYHEQNPPFRDARMHISRSTEVSFVPSERYLFPHIPAAADYEDISTLYETVCDFVRGHVDLTDPALYDILTSFIVASWRAEDFDSVPYLLFLGEIASGKSRALETLQELCYRGLRTSSISSAATVRLLEKHKATLLCDETDILNHESRFELLGILNCGYKQGDLYIRADPDSDDIEAWKTFGFKALAGSADFNKALNSRCIEIPMSRSTRKINLRIDKECAAKLRCKLLDYRLKNVKQPLSEIELPFKNGRNHELFMPLVCVAPESHRQAIIECGLRIERQREIENITSFEGDVLRALLLVVKQSKSDRFKVNQVFEEYKLLSDIDAEILNKKQPAYKNRIGRVLKNKFHLICNTKKEYYIDREKIRRAEERYTLPESDISDISDTPNTRELSDISYLSDIKGVLENKSKAEAEDLPPHPQKSDISDISDTKR